MDLINYEEDLRPVVADATLVEWDGSLEDKPLIEQSLYKKQQRWYDPKTTDSDKRNIWSEMFLEVKTYARSMVLQKLKNKKFLSPDEVDGHANNAALKFMSQYLYRVNFKCGTSFGKMINYKVLETVYGEVEDDKTLSLIMDGGDNGDLDLLSIQQRAEITPLWGQAIYDTEEEMNNTIRGIINGLFEEFDSEVDSDLLRLKMRMYFNLLLKKPKNRHIKDQFIKQNCLNKKEIDALNLIELELYKRYSVHRYINDEEDSETEEEDVASINEDDNEVDSTIEDEESENDDVIYESDCDDDNITVPSNEDEYEECY